MNGSTISDEASFADEAADASLASLAAEEAAAEKEVAAAEKEVAAELAVLAETSAKAPGGDSAKLTEWEDKVRALTAQLVHLQEVEAEVLSHDRSIRVVTSTVQCCTVNSAASAV